MESFHDLVKRLIRSFEVKGLDYAFTDALAVSFYGVPRTTADVDVLIHVSEERSIEKLVETLRDAGLNVDKKEIDRALRPGFRIATFRDSMTPYSVDLIFSKEGIEKRVGEVEGLRTFFQTPEDLILSKLRMIRATAPRERALDEEDIRAIMKFTRVDLETVRRKAERDGTLGILEAVIAGM